jgi:tRNA nucleotidyltransferase (CCA-adding enzyme)
MGRESDDIDICMDDMYGEDFAKMINDQLNKEGNTDKKRFGVIKANSEKSKHLETATIRVEGVMIDLVNLRSETYSEDSRVPEIEIGSPEQDSYRRDLTINSMFFNINERKIEDFTGKGLADI